MALQSMRTPCWAWALHDGRFSCSSNSRSSTAHHAVAGRLTRDNRKPRFSKTYMQSENRQGSFSGTAVPVQAPNSWQAQQTGDLPQATAGASAAAHPAQVQQYRGSAAAPLIALDHLRHVAQPTPHQQKQQQEQQQQMQRQDLLPDQQLFQQVEQCSSWSDCLQLLQTHGIHLDAMLLSALCTQTVHLYEVQQYNSVVGPKTRRLTGSPAQQQQQQHQQHQQQHQQHQQQQMAFAGAADATGSPSSSSSAVTARRTSRRISSGISGGGGTGLPESAAYYLFMQGLSELALRLAGSGTFRPQQFSNVLWCFARCGHRLPPLWLRQYLAQAQPELQQFQPRDFATLIWATATLQKTQTSQPTSSFMQAFIAASGLKLQRFNPIDIANTLWGLATLGAHPPTPWLYGMVAASASCWSDFKPFELSISVWGFAKLGARFTGPGGMLARQQQQWTGVPQPLAAAAAGGERGEGSVGLQESGFGWLLASFALLSPAMGLQEIANLLWGLAVGRAQLSQQQAQALGNQMCIILAQCIPAPAQPFTASLTVSLWAVSKLSWTPTLPQAQILVRLLGQVLLAGNLDMKHASILVYSLGQLRLRPPAAAVQYLMASLEPGLQGASMADVLQVLAGCRRLGWRVSRSWWSALYQDGLGALQQGTGAELVHLLATMASSKPLTPTAIWWEAFWGSLGCELEAAVAAKGLANIAHTRNLPKGSVSVAAGPLKAQAKQHGREVAAEQRQRRRALLSSSSSSSGRCGSGRCSSGSSGVSSGSNATFLAEGSQAQDSFVISSNISSSSSSSDGPGWSPHPLSWVAMVEGLQVVTNLHEVMQQHAQHNHQPPCTMTASRACVLLWASIKLKVRPPLPLLFQLLLVVLTEVHFLSPTDLALALWAVAHMLHMFGRRQVECFKVIQPLALVAQWRLMVGLAGSGRERVLVRKALRYLAAQDDTLMSLLLLHGAV